MILEFLNNYETFIAFHKKLENIGVNFETLYIAEEYKGPPKNVKYQLCPKDGIFSKKVLIIGENEKDLKSLQSYINNFPPCKDWKLIIRSKESKISAGNYMIVQKMKFTGTESVKEEIKKIVKELGGVENDIDYIFNRCEEKTLGYFPSNDSGMAQKYTDIIHTGATTPTTHKELISFLENAKKAAEYRAEMGDERSKSLLRIWDELLKLWKNKREQQENEVDIEQKYIEKYQGLVERDYISKLLKEYTEQEIIFEPIRNKVTGNDIDNLYLKIDRSELLIPKHKIEAIVALMSILDGSFPNETFISHLEKVLGTEFVSTLKEKRNELK
jgi:hypothetical protein